MVESIVTNKVDESLLNEFAELNAPEEETVDEAEEIKQVIKTTKTEVVIEPETKPATVEVKAEEIPEVKEERANPRLLRKNNELKKQLEEANTRIAKYEAGEHGEEEEVELSRQYVKDIAKVETLGLQSQTLDDQETAEFYEKYPDAVEFKAEIDKLTVENPALSLDFIYRALNPIAFVDRADIAKKTPKKYSTAGTTPSSITAGGDKKPDNKMDKTDIENELQALVKKGL